VVAKIHNVARTGMTTVRATVSQSRLPVLEHMKVPAAVLPEKLVLGVVLRVGLGVVVDAREGAPLE